MFVVKIGGSLAASADLTRWIEMIAAAGAGRVVLVPGGGPWADRVREMQRAENLDERTAHRLALRAMEHFGQILVEMNPRLAAAKDGGAIRAALGAGRIAVWMPHDMAIGDSAIPESWEVTSDSLAAWLARELGASRLVLVKSLPAIELQPSLEAMARLGWVDPRFPEFVPPGLEVRVLGKSDLQEAVRLIGGA